LKIQTFNMVGNEYCSFDVNPPGNSMKTSGTLFYTFKRKLFAAINPINAEP
jgi:hypothetical protein